MLWKKYILLKYIISFSLIVFSSLSYADSLSCGATEAIIIDAKSRNQAFFNLTLKNNVINKSYHFDIQKDFIQIRCEKRDSGDYLLLINHICSGSGCADFGNFGIIEAKTGAILLKANQPFSGNMNKAGKILGKEIKPFSCSKDRGEICLHSLIEIG